VSFEVENSMKSPTQIVRNSVRILSGVFLAVREFLEVRQPERLASLRSDEIPGELVRDVSLPRRNDPSPDGIPCHACDEGPPLTDFQIEKTSP
jgi:hypothetical protein